MDYTQAVAEARTLVKRSEEDQWRLAQLTHEQVERGISQNKWARDIGVARSWAQTLYKVWDQWGGQALATRPSFSDATHAIHKPAEHEATERLGTRDAARAEQIVRNLPPEEKAVLIGEALEDPKVADQIVRNPTTRRHLAEAHDEYSREMHQTAKERYELAEPARCRSAPWPTPNTRQPRPAPRSRT